MADLALIDLVGFWIGIFLTFCILSFLYKDNPFYKFAEHLFIGVSIGYVVTKQYYDTLRPKLIVNLGDGKWWYVIGLVLAVMLLMKLFRKTSHLGRYPIAFVVGLFAGLQITGVAQGDLGKQAEGAMQTVVAKQVDLNTGTKTELQLLPGFSPIVAQKVIDARAQKPFTSLDELTALPGLTEMQITDLEEARGSISGLDSQAAVLQMLPSGQRLEAMLKRLESFTATRESTREELGKLIAKAKTANDKAGEDDKKKTAKALAEAEDELTKTMKRFDDAAGLIAMITGLRDGPHSVVSGYELAAEKAIGAPAASRAGSVWIFGTLSNILLLLGLLAGLIYFYFSIEQKGPVGRVSRFGVWVLMIGFGASFGYTVQGRISLAIGRVLDITGANKDPNLAAQIHGVSVALVSICIIVVGLVVWEIRQRKPDNSGPSEDDPSSGDDSDGSDGDGDDDDEPEPPKSGADEEE